ncbi:hypothetical protein CKO40_02420 [Halochromatium glycolicum]|uniref:EamA domain-containing protein n=1 Tax=Halochromatium glycolicum TaxID=85075 RepID=A0AAJ0U1B8_9GAMM|nr:hypothetical protein [Halochromatium glycolicum]
MLLAGIVVLLWGTAATAFELALRWVTPFELLVYASATSVIALALILSAQRAWSRFGDVPRATWLQAAALGALNPFLYYLVLFAAYARLPGQIAMALNYAWPLVLALLAVPILRQPLSRRQGLAIGISFIGALIIVTGGSLSLDGIDPWGVALALGSTLIWASFWLLNARAQADPVIALFLGFGVGLLLALLASPLFGGIALPPAAAWPALIYVGLFEMGLTFVLWLTALQWSHRAARLAQLIYLAPFLSLVFLHLIIGEPIAASTPFGLALIIAAILWQRERTTSG